MNLTRFFRYSVRHLDQVHDAAHRLIIAAQEVDFPGAGPYRWARATQA